MPSPLLRQLKTDFPDLKFKTGPKFAFRYPNTIIIGPKEPLSDLLTLHEVSHALLKHQTYSSDIKRLKMESAAWDKAQELAIKYQIAIDKDFIQDQLDTYRNWLHQKSRCPKCGLTRFQSTDGVYHCPRCENFT